MLAFKADTNQSEGPRATGTHEASETAGAWFARMAPAGVLAPGLTFPTFGRLPENSFKLLNSQLCGHSDHEATMKSSPAKHVRTVNGET